VEAGHQAPPILSREGVLDVKLHPFYPERGGWMSSSTNFIQRGGTGCQAPPILSREGQLDVKLHPSLCLKGELLTLYIY